MANKIISTIENNPCIKNGKLAFDCNHTLIGIVTELKKGDTNYGFQEYLIAWIGGDVHGKTSYASDWQDLHDKVSECAREFFNKIKSIAH